MSTQHDWTPVRERLPEPWEMVRVRCAAGVRLARLGSCDLWMEPHSDYLVPGVTHWQTRTAPEASHV